MVDYIITILLASLISAFFINLAKKWSIIEWLQMHGSELISKMAHCDFCLSWWINVLVGLIVSITTGCWQMLFIPFFSTMITRFLL